MRKGAPTFVAGCVLSEINLRVRVAIWFMVRFRFRVRVRFRYILVVLGPKLKLGFSSSVGD